MVQEILQELGYSAKTFVGLCTCFVVMQALVELKWEMDW